MTTMEWHATTLGVGDDGEPVTKITWRPKDGRIWITARVARRLLREVVAEAGSDHSLDRQLNAYVVDRIPFCLIGRVLHRAGVTEDELRRLDVQDQSTIAEVRLPWRVTVTQAARRVLQAAQSEQDKGCTWGLALDVALDVRPYRRGRTHG